MHLQRAISFIIQLSTNLLVSITNYVGSTFQGEV